jgi:hypothetical protein
MADLFSFTDIPTYDCSQNQGTTALAVGAVLLAIATITVALRLYVRIILRNALGWDDYMITASLVSFSEYIMETSNNDPGVWYYRFRSLCETDPEWYGPALDLPYLSKHSRCTKMESICANVHIDMPWTYQSVCLHISH